MLMTSSMHHLEATADWITEAKTLLTGLTPCELALTLVWMTRIGADALLEGAEGKRDDALELLQSVGLALEETLSKAVAPGEVRD
jgi:hypothetical protein